MKWHKRLLLVFYLIIHIGAIIYSQDLEQINADHIFLDDFHLQKYLNFQEKTHENLVLINKIELKERLNDRTLNEYTLKIENLKKDLLPELLEIITFKDVYYKNKDTVTSEELLRLKKEKEPLRFNLLGEKHLASLFIFKKKTNPLELDKKIRLVTNQLSVLGSLKFAGLPYVNYQLNKYSQRIKFELFPLMFLTCLLFTLLITRSLQSLFLIFIPSLFSCFLSLALIKLFYNHMNMITSIIPLLIFVLSMALCFHLYFTTQEVGSFKITQKKKLPPILLMVFSTSIGFGSLYFSDIPIVRQFALLTFSLVLISSVITFIYCSLVYDSFFKQSHNMKNRKFFHFLLKKPSLKISLPLSLLLISLAIPAARKIPLNTNADSFFPKDSGIPESLESIYQDIFGSPGLEILLEKENDEFDFLDFQKISKFESEIKNAYPSYNLLSLNEFISEVNYLYSGNNYIPANRFSYFPLRSKIHESFLDSYQHDNIYRITLLGKVLSEKDYQEQYKTIEKLLRTIPYKSEINGLYYNLRSSQNSLILVLAKSFVLSLVIIALMGFFSFKHPLYFFSFLFVNLAPISCTLIAMKFLGLSFNIATIMTFSIALGMVVDGSFHIAHAKRTQVSAAEYLTSTALPIFLSSLILALSFALFGTYGFLPIKEFGICLALNIFFGLFFDLFVLTALLDKFAPKKP